MNIVCTPDEFDLSAITILKRIPNTVIDNSFFRRIVYSTADLSLNGIYILMPLKIAASEQYYNKARLSYGVTENTEIVQKICSIESTLLEAVKPSPNALPIPKLREQLLSGNIRIFATGSQPLTDSHIVLKISGIWETDAHYGVTFKFLEVTRQSRST